MSRPKKPTEPVALARFVLSRRVCEPARRLHALALTLRERDLHPEEIAAMAAAAETMRAAALALRRSADA